MRTPRCPDVKSQHLHALHRLLLTPEGREYEPTLLTSPARLGALITGTGSHVWEGPKAGLRFCSDSMIWAHSILFRYCGGTGDGGRVGRDSEPCRHVDGVDMSMDCTSVCGLSKGTAVYWDRGVALPGAEHEEMSLPHPTGGFLCDGGGHGQESGGGSI